MPTVWVLSSSVALGVVCGFGSVWRWQGWCGWEGMVVGTKAPAKAPREVRAFLEDLGSQHMGRLQHTFAVGTAHNDCPAPAARGVDGLEDPPAGVRVPAVRQGTESFVLPADYRVVGHVSQGDGVTLRGVLRDNRCAGAARFLHSQIDPMRRLAGPGGDCAVFGREDYRNLGFGGSAEIE